MSRTWVSHLFSDSRYETAVILDEVRNFRRANVKMKKALSQNYLCASPFQTKSKCAVQNKNVLSMNFR